MTLDTNGSKVTVIEAAGRLIYRIANFNLNLLNNYPPLPVPAGYTIATMQARKVSGTWATAVVTIKVSNDPDCVAIDTHPAGTFSLSAEGVTDFFPLNHAFLCPTVTTAEGAAGIADLFICMKAVGG